MGGSTTFQDGPTHENVIGSDPLNIMASQSSSPIQKPEMIYWATNREFLVGPKMSVVSTSALSLSTNDQI